MDLHPILCDMRRPKSLIRAARLGLQSRCEANTRAPSIEGMLTREKYLEDERRSGAAGYRAQDHVRLLTAILVEATKSMPIKA